jgi:hypothetical protein
MIAAPKLDEQMIIDNIGKTVSDNESLHRESSNNFKSVNSKNKENLDEKYDNSLMNDYYILNLVNLNISYYTP